jgi:hypothetical protein
MHAIELEKRAIHLLVAEGDTPLAYFGFIGLFLMLHISATKFQLLDMVVTLLLSVASDALYIILSLSIAVQCAHCIA